MRKGYDSELWIENGEFKGINLGADFVSEHEWGISGIQNAFGIIKDDSTAGISKRIVKKVPNNLLFRELTIEKKKYYVLILGYYSNSSLKKPIKELPPTCLMPCTKDDNLVCAWDENTFGILVSDKYKKELESLYNAFQNKDVMIGMSKGHVFQNGGLKIVIVSKMPDEMIDDVYHTDLDAMYLKKVAEETGIYKKLDKAGMGKNEYKGYIALAPRWKDRLRKEVVFWLNPYQQQKYNFGLYTVDELEQWIKGKGPVINEKNK